MSIKDDLNKGFTIGDITTSKYDDEAQIKVKEYYELDKLERGKLLELAGKTDIELAKRDIRINDIEDRQDNSENKISDLETINTNLDTKIKEVDTKVKNIENNGLSGGSYYTPDVVSKIYVFHKFEVEQEKLDDLKGLTLDKYNLLDVTSQSVVKNLLLKVGITDPTNLSSLENELKNSNSQLAPMILKVYGDSITIPVNKEFSFVVSDKIGMIKQAVSTKILDVVLHKMPDGSYSCVHSTAIGNISNAKAMSVYSVGNFPHMDIGLNTVYVINYLKDNKATNKFGIRISGSYPGVFENPYSITGSEVEEVESSKCRFLANYAADINTKTIMKSNTEYGNTDKYSVRTVRIGNQGKYITYDISLVYTSNQTLSNILENIPPYYLPYYNSPQTKGLDFNIYGNDGSITKGELIGTSTIGGTGIVKHSGDIKTGVIYTAKLQMRGAFQ